MDRSFAGSLAATTVLRSDRVSYAGMLADLVARVPDALRDAEARGDVYAATSFRTYRCSWAWLGMDRPDIAEQQVETAEREWTPTGYQFQHWHMSYARSEIDLYRGAPRRSLDRLAQDWKRGRLARQVHTVHGDMLFTRARLQLASAFEQQHAGAAERAARDGHGLIGLAAPWTVALGQLTLACTASFAGPEHAAPRFALAETQLAAAEMPLLAEVARVRRGQLTPDAVGQALVDSGLEAIKQRGAKRPEAFVAMLAPSTKPPRGRAL